MTLTFLGVRLCPSIFFFFAVNMLFFFLNLCTWQRKKSETLKDTPVKKIIGTKMQKV